jgi:DNA-binding IclR family transcriptional regulator
VATHSAVRSSGGAESRASASAAPGSEGARRALAALQAFSPHRHTLTARELSQITSIPLPSMYRYIALLRDTGLLIGDDRGAYRLSPQVISLARAAEAAEPPSET